MKKKAIKQGPNIRLREYRTMRNWTQEEFADKIDVSVQTLGRWETGKNTPSAFTKQRICKLLQASPQELGFEPEEDSLSSGPNILQAPILDELSSTPSHNGTISDETYALPKLITNETTPNLPGAPTSKRATSSILNFLPYRLMPIMLACSGLLILGAILLPFLHLPTNLMPSTSVAITTKPHIPTPINSSITCFARRCDNVYPHQTDNGNKPCLQPHYFTLLDQKIVYSSTNQPLGTLYLYFSSYCDTVWGTFTSNGNRPFHDIRIYTIRRDHPTPTFVSRVTTNFTFKDYVDAPMLGYDSGTKDLQVLARCVLNGDSAHGTTNTATFHIEGSIPVIGF